MTVCTFDHVVLVRYYELVVVTVWVGLFCLLHLVTVCTFDHVVLVRYSELVVVTV